MRRIKSGIVATIFLSMVIAGCTPKKEDVEERPVTIVFKHGKTEGDPRPLRELIKTFEIQNPDVRVKEEILPPNTDEQHQYYVINLEGKSKDFDVFAIDVIWGPEFAQAGWLMDVEDILPPEERHNFFAAPIQAVTYKGTIYGVPWYMDAGILYYRKDLLEKYGLQPPKTWDDLVSVASEIMKKEPGITGFVWQGKQYEGLVCNVLEFFWSSGGEVLHDGNTVINSPENKRALKFMKNLIYEYRVTPESVTSATEEEARMLFGHGKAVFMRNWPYAWSIYNREGSRVKGKVAITVLPHFKGGVSASTLGGWQLAVNLNSTHPREAKRLIKFLTSYEAQKKMSLTVGYKPALKSLYSDTKLVKEQPYLPTLYKVFEKARPRPVTHAYIRISQIMQSEFSSVLSNLKEPEEALKSANEEIEKVLEVGK